jgi:hypothetical protein
MLIVFGRSSKNIRLVAFLLPLTFVWNWAACSLLCSEIVERHHARIASFGEPAGEVQLNVFEMDDCPFTASAAVLETRQTVNAPATVVEKTSSPSRPEYLIVPAIVYKSDLNQNSPPRGSPGPPLFLRHHAFRI